MEVTRTISAVKQSGSVVLWKLSCRYVAFILCLLSPLVPLQSPCVSRRECHTRYGKSNEELWSPPLAIKVEQRDALPGYAVC